jgi:L-threonylcarbamoyladenylate synthase
VASDAVQQAIDAIRAGKPVLLPTDTVYGLCASAYREAPVQRLYELKGRTEDQPTALLASSVDMLFECVPELRGRVGVIARTLLPGPYTLVLPNPARRYRWLHAMRPDTIGVRVAELPTLAQRVLDAVGAVAATSANEPDDPAPASLDDVPSRIRSACAAELDAGRLPGVASTVIDFTGAEPAVLREGAAPAAEAIARAEHALRAARVA